MNKLGSILLLSGALLSQWAQAGDASGITFDARSLVAGIMNNNIDSWFARTNIQNGESSNGIISKPSPSEFFASRVSRKVEAHLGDMPVGWGKWGTFYTRMNGSALGMSDSSTVTIGTTRDWWIQARFNEKESTEHGRDSFAIGMNTGKILVDDNGSTMDINRMGIPGKMKLMVWYTWTR